jgi:hypothetical protein
MGGEYNVCRDAYFTCMDQFCANRDATYRRCACSSKLTTLRDAARQISGTETQLQTFTDYNIDAISKTATQVSATLTATAGESAAVADTSQSATQLAGISSVLNGARTNALATNGSLDVAGDINAIWNTPDFIGGADIANLEGEKLYTQVHSQCAEMVANSCGADATLNMVVSAYGMYIEQDCNIAAAAISGQKTAAESAVRVAATTMESERLENYNTHNSTEINDCIARVRADITTDAACGTNFVHCLDLTGLYLDYNTGAPIYSSDFFKLENAMTLDGDFMSASKNQNILLALEEKKAFAADGLDTCRDVANDVWSEFKRQAVIEIYQAQQAAVRDVRDNCLGVINQCWDEKIGQLKNFANLDSQMLVGQSVATAQSLCSEQVNACSNLFGGGTNGLASLLDFVSDIGNAKIAEGCAAGMDAYIHEVCAVADDLSHSYPYSCRLRDPGSYPNPADGSVYDLLVKYARENCVAPNYSATAALPSDIMEYVNKAFDSVFTEMRTALKIECEKYNGEWIDNPGGTSASNIDLYLQMVSASDKWGACIKPYCVYQGDAWIGDNGVKHCCKSGEIVNESGDGCRSIDCTSNAQKNTTICNNFVSAPVNSASDLASSIGGCVANNCKCSNNYWAIPDGSTIIPGVSTDGMCIAVCPQNSSFNNSCTGKGEDNSAGGALGATNNEGCVKQYCRCNTNYIVKSATLGKGAGCVYNGPLGGGGLGGGGLGGISDSAF